jgi:hypothetical protein
MRGLRHGNRRLACRRGPGRVQEVGDRAQVADHLAAGLRRSVPGTEVHPPAGNGGNSTLEAVPTRAYSLVPTVVSGSTGLEPDPAVCIRQAGRLLEQLAPDVLAQQWPGR